MKLSVKTSPPEDIEDVKSAIAESVIEHRKYDTREDAEAAINTDFVAPPKTAKKNILEARVLKRARNYRYVYAVLDGERIAVLVPRHTRKSLIGKTVKVARAKGADDVVTYTLIP